MRESLPVTRRFPVLLLALLALLPAGLAAQPASPDFPTVAALNAAVVPQRDLTDLAYRLSGLEAIAPPPTNPAPLAVGTVRTLWASDTSNDRSFQFDAELLVVGDHIYIWAEVGAGLPRPALERLARQFDDEVYMQARALWGSEATPGVDGDPRIHAVFVRSLGFGVGAYYAGKHSYPVEAVPSSNEMEMMFYNLDTIAGALGTDIVRDITAHEFQHMIRANVDGNEDGWMDEGFSTFTEWFLGTPSLGFVLSFQANPNTQLNTWTEDGSRAADYGAAQLWVTYLYERFGVAGIRALSADPANGFYAVENLARANGTDADTLFADWVVANLLRDPALTGNDAFGYRELSGLPAPVVTEATRPLAPTRLMVPQYATQYVRLADLGGASSLVVTVSSPREVGLAPITSPSGTPMWYSNRGDDSNTRLTFAVDLTTATAPALDYRVWYHIENLWDYGYVMASTDGGTTWDILVTPAMTTENPHLNAYGPGYTGQAGGWLDERIDLSAYAGQAVLLRFEMIYDDAINQPGMFVDSVRVSDPTAGTLLDTDFAGFAAPGFSAEGWVLTDNRLPQQVWVQLVAQGPDGATVERWRHPGGDATYTPSLPAGTTTVTVALSPFAPTTTVPAPLTLKISAAG